MKKTICMLVFAAICSIASAQLADTKWKSSMNIPDPVECIFQFKKDTALILVAGDGTLVETMLYSISKDTLKLTKVSGMSPCTEVVGIYKFELKDEKLFIRPLSDDCSERANAFNGEAWIKEK